MTSAACMFPDIDTSQWTVVETSVFSFRVPPELRRVNVQGYDSLVGRWDGESAWITYDFGRYSGPPKQSEDLAEFHACVALIDGREAQVATYRRDDGAFAVSAYWADIGRGDKRLSMFGEAQDTTSRSRLLALVAQVRFLRQSSPSD